MFTHTYETRYGDYKDFDTIKTGSVLDIIQDVSTRDSARLGYGIEELNALRVAWLMQGICVKFENKISTGCNIDAFTAVKSVRGVTSERGCILSQNGEVCAKSIANWFLFNVDRGKIAKIPPEMQEVYEIYDFVDEFFSYEKLLPDETIAPSYTVRVSNKEIDTNMHLNNQKGADLLMDALPFDFDFNTLRILYKKPAFLGDVLEVCVKETEKGYYVHLQTTDKDICVAGTFEK